MAGILESLSTFISKRGSGAFSVPRKRQSKGRPGFGQPIHRKGEVFRQKPKLKH